MKITLETFIIKNPKLSRKPVGVESLFPYYAGYSSEFVQNLLETLPLGPDAFIVDPWNGSGTTTTIANKLGFQSGGSDLNPAMIIISKAKLINAHDISNIDLTLKKISRFADRPTKIFLDTEPLETWFPFKNARYFRQLEISIQKAFSLTGHSLPLNELDFYSDLSPLGSFFYLGLFRTLKKLLVTLYSTNPTWIKQPKMENKLEPSQEIIIDTFRLEISSMTSAIIDHKEQLPLINKAILKIAESSELPFESLTVDLVITSPPYCTRIDYGIATLPELTILGFNPKKEFRALRCKLIGTSTVPEEAPARNILWGQTCSDFLEKILMHESKASRSYYYKNHLQYFESIFKSIEEIQRILKSGGKCIIVVQDSYYKDIYNNLAQVLTEMFLNTDLKLLTRKDFISENSMSGRNPAVKNYRLKKKPIESVLCFEKD